MTVAVRSSLGATGLSDEQLLHFAEHGWVALDDVIDEAACAAYIAALDSTLAPLVPTTSPYPTDRGNTRSVPDPPAWNPLFLDLFTIPGLMEAYRQLIGHPSPRYYNSVGFVATPDRERATQRELLMDPHSWGWHRAYEPKWNVRPHDSDPRLIHSSVIAAGIYLTPISPEDGATALLGGSHRIDGRWEEDTYPPFGDQCTFAHPTAGPGSMVIFSESLVHAGVPIVSDRRRVAVFTWMSVPWFKGASRSGPPPFIDRYADEDLRSIFRPATSGDD